MKDKKKKRAKPGSYQASEENKNLEEWGEEQ